MSSFISRNLTEIEAITGCTFACICNTVFRMFSCLQINCQPFYLPQLLKFHQFDWLIEIYLQTKGQGTHHKMVSLQPMSGFSPLLPYLSDRCCAWPHENDIMALGTRSMSVPCMLHCACPLPPVPPLKHGGRRPDYRFLVQSSGRHLLRFQDIQGRFTVFKSK